MNGKDSSVPISESGMTPFAETLRHLDDLMAEARLLRERITAALRREESDDTAMSPTNPTGVGRINKDRCFASFNAAAPDDSAHRSNSQR
jgi:hypothetical protein